MSDSLQLQVQTLRGLNSIAVRPKDLPLRLTDLLRKEHFPLNTRCGERGSCKGCLVEVLSGRLVHLKTGEIVETGLVRGCEFCLGDSAAEIRVPACSLLAYEPQVVSEFRLNIPRAHDPLWQVLEVPPECSLSQALARANRRHPVHIAKNLPEKLGSKAFATLEYRGDLICLSLPATWRIRMDKDGVYGSLAGKRERISLFLRQTLQVCCKQRLPLPPES